jgi:imidazolonepropionase-like amidohydrolase
MVAGQSGLVALSGWTIEGMAIKRRAALHVYWPDMDLNLTPKEKFKDASKWKSLEDQAKEREKKLKSLDDFFDDARAYAKAKKSGKFEVNPSWEAMLPYVSGELPIMIHADEIRQIEAAVNWAKTNQFKVILAGARDAWMTAEFLATNKIPVLYEHVFTQPARDSDSYDVHFKAPEVLRKAGVKVATGMGANTFDAALMKNLPYQAAQAVAFGFPKEEALKSITLYPAELMGIAERIGSIEVGKEATFVVLDGDILDIRSNVKQVWISGKEMSLETRHTRLYEKYKNRPKAK